MLKQLGMTIVKIWAFFPKEEIFLNIVPCHYFLLQSFMTFKNKTNMT